jgi:hypothetical protein
MTRTNLQTYRVSGKPLRVLVCGGRDYPADAVWHYLEHYAPAELGANIAVLIHGGATGADQAAAEWGARAASDGVKTIEFKANWRKYGKSAGPFRNQRMLAEGKPDAVIAFAGGRGTADMVARAEACGVRVIRA